MLVHLLQSHDRLALGDGIVQGEVGAQSVAVLHQHVPAKTEPGFFARGLLIEHAFRVGRALVGLVAALLPVKIDGGIAGIVVLGRPGLSAHRAPSLRTKLFRLAHDSMSVPSAVKCSSLVQPSWRESS